MTSLSAGHFLFYGDNLSVLDDLITVNNRITELEVSNFTKKELAREGVDLHRRLRVILDALNALPAEEQSVSRPLFIQAANRLMTLCFGIDDKT